MPKTYDELLGLLKPEEADVIKSHVAALLKTKDDEIGTLTAKISTHEATIATHEATIKSLKESTDADKTVDTETLLKSADPALAQMFKAMKEANERLVADQAEALAKSRYDAVKAIPGVPEADMKSILKTVSPAVFDVMCKAAKAIEDSLLKGKGSGADGSFQTSSKDQAYSKLEKSARDLMTADTTLSFEQAFTNACVADPKTYADYVKGE